MTTYTSAFENSATGKLTQNYQDVSIKRRIYPCSHFCAADVALPHYRLRHFYLLLLCLPEQQLNMAPQRRCRVKNKLVHQGRPERMSFLDLPFEIRELIYYKCLHRSSLVTDRNSLGCTVILRLNRFIYGEAIDILRNDECLTVVCTGEERPVFRRPRSQGKPNLFISTAVSSACDIHRGISELEFIKLRRVEVDLSWFCENAAAITREVECISNALAMSTTIKELRLNFGDLSDPDERHDDYRHRLYAADVPESRYYALQNLILQAEKQGIRITYTLLDTHPSDIEVLDDDGMLIKYIPPIVRFLRSRPDPFETVPTSSTTTFNHHSLIPECPRCFDIFPTSDHLATHLIEFPCHNKATAHRGPYNWIHPLATRGGNRHACRVCARSFSALENLTAHETKYKHGWRSKERGIVPRWKADNNMYPLAGGGRDRDMPMLEAWFAELRTEVAEWERGGCGNVPVGSMLDVTGVVSGV